MLSDEVAKLSGMEESVEEIDDEVKTNRAGLEVSVMYYLFCKKYNTHGFLPNGWEKNG